MNTREEQIKLNAWKLRLVAINKETKRKTLWDELLSIQDYEIFKNRVNELLGKNHNLGWTWEPHFSSLLTFLGSIPLLGFLKNWFRGSRLRAKLVEIQGGFTQNTESDEQPFPGNTIESPTNRTSQKTVFNPSTQNPPARNNLLDDSIAIAAAVMGLRQSSENTAHNDQNKIVFNFLKDSSNSFDELHAQLENAFCYEDAEYEAKENAVSLMAYEYLWLINELFAKDPIRAMSLLSIKYQENQSGSNSDTQSKSVLYVSEYIQLWGMSQWLLNTFVNNHTDLSLQINNCIDLLVLACLADQNFRNQYVKNTSENNDPIIELLGDINGIDDKLPGIIFSANSGRLALFNNISQILEKNLPAMEKIRRQGMTNEKYIETSMRMLEDIFQGKNNPRPQQGLVYVLGQALFLQLLLIFNKSRGNDIWTEKHMGANLFNFLLDNGFVNEKKAGHILGTPETQLELVKPNHSSSIVPVKLQAQERLAYMMLLNDNGTGLPTRLDGGIEKICKEHGHLDSNFGGWLLLYVRHFHRQCFDNVAAKLVQTPLYNDWPQVLHTDEPTLELIKRKIAREPANITTLRNIFDNLSRSLEIQEPALAAENSENNSLINNRDNDKKVFHALCCLKLILNDCPKEKIPLDTVQIIWQLVNTAQGIGRYLTNNFTQSINRKLDEIINPLLFIKLKPENINNTISWADFEEARQIFLIFVDNDFTTLVSKAGALETLSQQLHYFIFTPASEDLSIEQVENLYECLNDTLENYIDREDLDKYNQQLHVIVKKIKINPTHITIENLEELSSIAIEDRMATLTQELDTLDQLLLRQTPANTIKTQTCLKALAPLLHSVLSEQNKLNMELVDKVERSLPKIESYLSKSLKDTWDHLLSKVKVKTLAETSNTLAAQSKNTLAAGSRNLIWENNNPPGSANSRHYPASTSAP